MGRCCCNYRGRLESRGGHAAVARRPRGGHAAATRRSRGGHAAGHEEEHADILDFRPDRVGHAVFMSPGITSLLLQSRCGRAPPRRRGWPGDVIAGT